MTPVWQSALAASFGVAGLASAATTIALARRAGRARAGREDLARRVDDLSIRVRALETRATGEGDGPAGRNPRQPGRAARPGVVRRVDPAEPNAAAGPTLIAVPSLTSGGSDELATEAAAELGRRFGAVWDLADSGESPRAIARATGHPIGQVELILGLRRPSPGAVGHG